jgi:hypothetical protein
MRGSSGMTGFETACVPCASGCSPAGRKDRPIRQLQSMLHSEAARGEADSLGGQPLLRRYAGKEFRPLNYHHAFPHLGRNGGGKVVTLPDGQVAEASLGFRCLSYVHEAAAGDVHAVEHVPSDRRRAWGGRAAEQLPHLIREPGTAFLPAEEVIRRAGGGCQRTEPLPKCLVQGRQSHTSQSLAAAVSCRRGRRPAGAAGRSRWCGRRSRRSRAGSPACAPRQSACRCPSSADTSSAPARTR